MRGTASREHGRFATLLWLVLVGCSDEGSGGAVESVSDQGSSPTLGLPSNGAKDVSVDSPEAGPRAGVAAGQGVSASTVGGMGMLTGDDTPTSPMASEPSVGSGLDGVEDVDAGMVDAEALLDAGVPTSEPRSTGWGLAVQIADTEGPFSVNAAMDVNGNAIASWTNFQEDPEGVYANYYDADVGRWWNATLVERVDHSLKAASPQVGLDAKGNALVVWHRESEDLVSSQVWGNRYDADKKAWDQARRVSSGTGMLTELVVHPSGDATGLWTRIDGLSISLATSHYEVEAREWSAAEDFERSSGIGASIIPIVATSREGAAVVAWTKGDLLTGTVTAQARRLAVGASSWGIAEEVARDTTMVGNTTLIVTGAAINDAGTAFVVWQDAEQEQVTTVWVSRYDESLGVWGEPERLGLPGMEVAQLPQIAVDPAGNAIAVWGAYVQEHQQVWVNHYRANVGRWEGAQVLESDSDANCLAPQIGVDDMGYAILVFTRQNVDGEAVWSNRYDALTERWESSIPLDLGGLSEGAEPRLAVSPNGEAVVVWMNWSGGVYANHFRP